MFFWKKCRWSYCFQKWAEYFNLLSKIFRQDCENCFRRVHRINLRISFEKKKICHSGTLTNPFRHSVEDFPAGLPERTMWILNHFRTLSEKVSPFCQIKGSRATKTASTCLQEQFERKTFLNKSLQFLLIFSDIEHRKFGFLSIFFRSGFPKVYRTCQKEHFDEKCFLKTDLRLQFFFGLWP